LVAWIVIEPGRIDAQVPGAVAVRGLAKPQVVRVFRLKRR